MRNDLPTIAKSARQVLVVVNQAVLRFPRAHRYGVGADLRRESMAVCRCVQRAWHDRSRLFEHVEALDIAIDNLKVTQHLAKDLNAYGSFGEFEALARLTSALGRQCGGWLKHLRSSGQNGRAVAPSQRAQILSSQDASAQGANP